MIGKPKLANLPQHMTSASWLETHPDDPLCIVRREEKIVRWHCGVCGASGRHWANDRPAKCPGCDAAWE